MKNILFVFALLLFQSFIFAQEKELLKILNTELKKEVKNQFQSSNFNGDTISIIKPFTINEQKILSFEIQKTSPYLSGIQIIRQEVPLNKIVKIGKDINVIFVTEGDAVISTSKIIGKDATAEKVAGYLFFLFLSNEKHNEHLGISIQKAFEKAGYSVTKDFWYD